MTDVKAEVARRAKDIENHRNMPLTPLIDFLNGMGFRVIQLSQSGLGKSTEFHCLLGSDEGAVYPGGSGHNAHAAVCYAFEKTLKWLQDATPSMLAANGNGYRHLHDFSQVNPQATAYPGLAEAIDAVEVDQEQVQRPVVREREAPFPAPRVRERQRPAQPTPEHVEVQRPVVRERVRSAVPPVDVTVRQRVNGQSVQGPRRA